MPVALFKSNSAMPLKSFLSRLIWMCVLPLVLLAALLAFHQVRTLQARRDAEAASLARNFAVALDRNIAGRLSALQVLAASSALNSPKRLGEFYRAGHMIFNTRLPLGASLPDLPKVRGHSSVATALATGKPSIGDMFFGPVVKLQLVSIAVPVYREGRVDLLLAITEARQFQHSLDELTIPEGWSISVLDGKDEVVASRRAATRSGHTGADLAEGRFVIKSALSPWTVVLEIPRDRYLAPTLSAVAVLAAAILAATFASVLGGMFASRRLARSVAALAGTAQSDPRHPLITEIETVRTMLVEAAASREGAESTLRKSEERYRSLVESAPIAIFINRDGRIEYANAAAVRLFGYGSARDLLGSSPFDLVHPNFHAAMKERISVVLRGGSVPLVETVIVQAGGIERAVEVVAALCVDGQGPAVQVMMRDVTERKQAEGALRESEERMRQLGDNLPDSYVYQYTQDADGTPRFLYLSVGVERLHGVSREEVLRDAGALHGQIDPVQIQAMAALEADSLHEMTDFGMELHMCRADGRWRWMQVRSRPRRREDGRVVWDGVATDVTDRKQAETWLRESEAKYRLTLDCMLEGCQIVGFDWRYLYLNDAAQMHNRRPNTELLGRTVMECWPGITETYVFGREEDCMRDRTPQHLNSEFVFPDGHTGWFRLIIQPMAEGIAIFSEDITDRKLAEDAARLSTQLLLRAEEKAHLGHWRYDLRRADLFCSEETCRILGVDRDHFAFGPVPYEELVHPDDLAGAKKELARLLRDGKSELDSRILRPDGEVRYVALTGELVREEAGEAAAMFGTIQDMTRLKRQERELHDKNAELERFTYMISHDLKSPLVTVKTFLGYLEEDLAGSDRESIRKDLFYMNSAADKMDRLLHELLEMSRIGRVVKPPVPVGFDELVAEALNAVAGSVAERGVELRVCAEPLVLYGDRSRLVEIWQNLLENAVKFMGEQPAPLIEIGWTRQESGTIFYVKDNGQGVDPRYARKIFGLFEKLDPKAEGTGLGLALVTRIVELYGGSIWLEPERTVGSCFRFVLPDALPEKQKGATL